MGFKSVFREYFTFNRRQRNGVFVLLSIILILTFYLSFSDYFFSSEKIDFAKFDKEVELFEADLLKHADSSVRLTTNNFISSNTPETNEPERFVFNPNNLPAQDWARLGLTERQIKVIKNYEDKGGKFRTKEDVKKMYVISPVLYASLEPFIRIPVDTARKSYVNSYLNTKEIEIIELNSADTITLDKLKGIGFGYAKRIIKYKELLGGYVNKEQLLEVYGLDKEKFELISGSVTVDLTLVKKINLNAVGVQQLKQHPYIKYNLANLIVNYRKQHGNYKSVEEIKQLDLMSEENYIKLAPYLTID